MGQQRIDVLAFGAHADDVEIGMAGSIAKWTAAGKRVVICDLTKAELSSNGTVEMRAAEAEAAANFLGVYDRVNLGLPDRGLFVKQEYIRSIVDVIRKYNPTLIFAPYYEDRHPDHGHCASLVQEAYFSAGIRKYRQDTNFSVHKASNLFYYFINSHARPDFFIDISLFMEDKLSALKKYKSQFLSDYTEVPTPLTDGYLEGLYAREKLFGKEAGVTFAEGFKTRRPLLMGNDIFGEPS